MFISFTLVISYWVLYALFSSMHDLRTKISLSWRISRCPIACCPKSLRQVLLLCSKYHLTCDLFEQFGHSVICIVISCNGLYHFNWVHQNKQSILMKFEFSSYRGVIKGSRVIRYFTLSFTSFKALVTFMSCVLHFDCSIYIPFRVVISIAANIINTFCTILHWGDLISSDRHNIFCILFLQYSSSLLRLRSLSFGFPWPASVRYSSIFVFHSLNKFWKCFFISGLGSWKCKYFFASLSHLLSYFGSSMVSESEVEPLWTPCWTCHIHNKNPLSVHRLTIFSRRYQADKCRAS